MSERTNSIKSLEFCKIAQFQTLTPLKPTTSNIGVSLISLHHTPRLLSVTDRKPFFLNKFTKFEKHGGRNLEATRFKSILSLLSLSRFP